MSNCRRSQNSRCQSSHVLSYYKISPFSKLSQTLPHVIHDSHDFYLRYAITIRLSLMNSVLTNYLIIFSFFCTARTVSNYQIPLCDSSSLPQKSCHPHNFLYSLKIREYHCTWWLMDCRPVRPGFGMRCKNGSWGQNVKKVVCFKIGFLRSN